MVSVHGYKWDHAWACSKEPFTESEYKSPIELTASARVKMPPEFRIFKRMRGSALSWDSEPFAAP